MSEAVQVQSNTIRCPQKLECEDALVVRPEAGLFAVLDGVTPLCDFRDNAGHNGAYLAANLVKRVLEESTLQQPLREDLVCANRMLDAAMRSHGIDTSILHELWATCAAVVRIENRRMSFAQLGDCMIAVRRKDGSFESLTRDRVAGMNGRARAKRERDRSGGASLPDETWYDEDPKRKYAYNRWMANTDDGYGVANGREEAAHHIQEGTLDLTEVSHVFVMSDGLFHPSEGVLGACAGMVRLGLNAYADWLAQEEERLGRRPDDKTAIMLTVSF